MASTPRGKAVTVAIGLGLGGLVLGYGVATRVLFPSPPPPRGLLVVPDLRGAEPEAAALSLIEAGLTAGGVDLIRHPTADSGTVIAQGPLPGQLSRPGGSVRVTVSLGPERRSVPDVLGLTDKWARNLLEASGFTITVDSVEAEESLGTVVAIEPEVGTELALPSEIAVTVSLGPPLVPMPRVLGMPEAMARDTLEALGFTLERVEEVFRFGRDRGLVIEQSPPADSLLEIGSRVQLSVGRRGRRQGG